MVQTRDSERRLQELLLRKFIERLEDAATQEHVAVSFMLVDYMRHAFKATLGSLFIQALSMVAPPPATRERRLSCGSATPQAEWVQTTHLKSRRAAGRKDAERGVY